MGNFPNWFYLCTCQYFARPGGRRAYTGL